MTIDSPGGEPNEAPEERRSDGPGGGLGDGSTRRDAGTGSGLTGRDAGLGGGLDRSDAGRGSGSTGPGAGLISGLSDEFMAFWKERHLATLTTVRADGTPHVVPVGVTLDLSEDEVTARVISSRSSHKARQILAAGPEGAAVAVCQVDGPRWSTMEGRAVVRDDPTSVADAERRYTERYRPPRPNPERVVIEIRVTRVLGNI